jgi:DNA polymerase III subunit epsilon
MSDLPFRAHDLVPTGDGRVRCQICEQTWKREPGHLCPGVKAHRWEPWPEGLFTRKQVDEKGYKPGPVAGVIYREKSPDGWMRLYRLEEATPKRELSEAQRAAMQKTQAALRVGRTCQRCGYPLRHYVKGGGLCERCIDRVDAIQWATDMLARGFVVLDTETTGLYDAEIVEISVLDHHGGTLIDTLVRPLGELPPDATAIHGITPQMVESAPTFAEIYPALVESLCGRDIVIYNAAFDTGVLRYCWRQDYLPALPWGEVHCAMEWYAQYIGEWSHYHGNYRWQRLDGGHRAREDCLACLDVIRSMAKANEEEEAHG